MNEQINHNSTGTNKCTKNTITILVSVFVTTLIVGGGVYVWQNSKLNKAKDELDVAKQRMVRSEEQIMVMSKQIDSGLYCNTDFNHKIYTNPHNQKRYSTSTALSKWQSYISSYGFSLEYPSYLIEEENTSSILKAKSNNNDRFSIEIYEQSLDGIEYIDQPGSFGFVYSADKKKWINKYGEEELPEKLYPKKYKNNKGFLAYYVNIGDAAVSGKKAYIENPEKNYVITISQSRNGTTNPLSNENTFFKILDSLIFNNLEYKEFRINNWITAEIPKNWSTYEMPERFGTDQLPASPTASIGKDGVSFGDGNRHQFDLYFAAHDISAKLIEEEKGKNYGSWSNETVNSIEADVVTYPLDDRGKVSKGGTGGKKYFIRLPEKNMKTLVIRKQALGEEEYEDGFEHFLKTLKF